MREIVSTKEFDDFEANLKDMSGRARIQARIERLAAGNPGSHRDLKHGVSELKIDVGPGYRVYYTLRQDGFIVILLAGVTSRRRMKTLNEHTSWCPSFRPRATENHTYRSGRVAQRYQMKEL